MNKTKVLLSGITGKMGRACVNAIHIQKDIEIVGGVGTGALTSIKNKWASSPVDVQVFSCLEQAILETRPDIVVDFTRPELAFKHTKIALENNVKAIVGTTGFTDDDYKVIHKLSIQTNTAAIIVPNFSIGYYLSLQCAKLVSKYIQNLEIVETHHDKKVDAPSGTAIQTALEISEGFNINHDDTNGMDLTSRGMKVGSVPVHAVRLPGKLAHQSYLFGKEGESITITHDVLDRTCYMDGVILAIRKILDSEGLLLGLSSILDA